MRKTLAEFTIVELESMPRDQFRLLNMSEVVARVAILAEPEAISIESEIVGNKIRLTATMPPPKLIDRRTGKLLRGAK